MGHHQLAPITQLMQPCTRQHTSTSTPTTLARMDSSHMVEEPLNYEERIAAILYAWFLCAGTGWQLANIINVLS
jgi:hypothetical protein